MQKHYILGILALGLMTSCQEEEIFEKGQLVDSDVVVRATLDQSSTTRTQLTSNENNNGYKVLWADNDALSIFSSNSAHAKFVLSKGAGEANADFKFNSGDLNFTTEDGSNDFGYVGVYPYSESTTISKNETGYVINTVIPTEQACAVNSFGQDASPMVAVDPSLKLSFKNVGSILVLPMKGEGTITSATLKSNNHKIAGTATVTVTEENGWIPAVDVTNGASEVVLTCGEEGVKLNATTATNFFFVLAPGTYEANDLVITFNNADGKCFETTIGAENNFERSKSVKFSERTFEVTGVVDGVTTEEALKSAIAAGESEVTLDADIDLDTSVVVENDLIVNLNGKSIKCASSDVFIVTAGTLTINGDGLVYGSEDNSSSSCAVWAKENGVVIINGGTYKVGHDEASKATSANWRNDCIYARDNAKITINGGEFMYAGNVDDNNVQSDGHRFLLNCRDVDYKAGTCSITVMGGTFHNFNPGSTSSENPVANYVAPGYSSVASEDDTYVVSKGIFSEVALKAAIINGAEITLNADVTIEKAITIPTGIAATINLNGFDITAPNTDAFEVAGTLTIKDTNNEGVVSAGTANPNASVCAVWANGGTVTIDGGHYKVYSDAAGKRNDCIYAGYNADDNNTAGMITINGGKFEYVWPDTKNSGTDYNGDMFLLNCADKDLYQTLITVNGGEFKNNAPSYEATTPQSRSDNEVKLGEGKKVYNGVTEVTAAHNGTTDIWYVVKQ